jgi:tetratricopeptide (TPR) repeat protein
MIAAAYSGNATSDVVADSSVLRLVLKREAARRRQAIADDERLLKMENLVTLACLVGGLLPRSGAYSFLSGFDVSSLLPDLDLLDLRVYRDVVAASSNETILSGLQPDLLGERFVLDRLTAESGVGRAARRLLIVAWKLQPNDLSDFIVRAASDFPDDAALDILCALPLDSPEARGRWGRLVGDLVRVANRSTDTRTKRLFDALVDLAGRYPAERELQKAIARAQLYLGNIFLFSEGDYDKAAERFEAAIRLAGSGSEIAVAAVNNRGILHHEIQNEERALADWNDVVATDGVSDEPRACALNNRADVFARRGLHDQAVRDRAAVLALRETTSDRRYIALFRRSESYVKLGQLDHALHDLESILSTDDITPQQKAEARVSKGALLRDLERFEEAREDLEAVLATDEVFRGTHSEALVELGELERLQGDMDRARSYLDAASMSSNVRRQTLIEALIVRARVFLAEGDSAGAENIWQSILANPSATARQKSIAASRGLATTSPPPGE